MDVRFGPREAPESTIVGIRAPNTHALITLEISA
jgi:hypothetical protein